MTTDADRQAPNDPPVTPFNLGEVLQRSVEITLRHRVLWVYGVLLALFSGDCARVPGNSFDINRDQEGQMSQALQSIDSQTALVWGTAIVAVVLVVLIGLMLLGNWATGSLLGGVHMVSMEGHTSFRSATEQGRLNFWRLLLLGLISLAIVTAVILPTAATIVLSIAVNPVFLITLCLWGPLLLIVLLLLSLVVTIAQIHVVLDEAGPIASLRFSWSFLRRHAGDIALVWLVNDLAVGCSVGCALSAVAGLAAVPAVIGFLINPAVGMLLLIPAALGALVVVFLAGIAQVFHRAVWVLSYERLRDWDQQAELGPVVP
ncbi:MAG: hypothetical protein EXR51_06680 [Dehalococcoidia bacterium]|nr:hypothetical protein [Dehalococcoidia bacterium]